MADFCFHYECFNLNIEFNTSSNISEEDILLNHFPYPLEFRIIFITLYILLFLLSIFGNAFLCYILNRLSRTIRPLKRFLLISTAFSDITTNVVCAPVTIATEAGFHWWAYGPVMCPLIQFLQMTCAVQKSLNMVALNYDQHCAISKPMKAIQKTKLKIMILFTWVIGVSVALPLVSKTRYAIVPFTVEEIGLCIEIWNYEYQRTIYSLCVICIQFLFPLLVVIVFNVHVGYIIWTNVIPGEKDVKRDRNISKTKKRGVKMLVIVVLIYGITWLPLHVLTILEITGNMTFNSMTTNMMWMAFHWLALSNTGTNCAVFLSRNNEIRNQLKKTLLKRKSSEMFPLTQRSEYRSSIQSRVSQL